MITKPILSDAEAVQRVKDGMTVLVPGFLACGTPETLIDAEYEIEPLLAPSPAIRDAYKTTKDWAAYERSFMALIEQRRLGELILPERFSMPTAMLCSEPTPEKCHRRLLAEYFADRWRSLGHSVEIEHLVLPKPQGKLAARSARA